MTDEHLHLSHFSLYPCWCKTEASHSVKFYRLCQAPVLSAKYSSMCCLLFVFNLNSRLRLREWKRESERGRQRLRDTQTGRKIQTSQNTIAVRVTVLVLKYWQKKDTQNNRENQNTRVLISTWKTSHTHTTTTKMESPTLATDSPGMEVNVKWIFSL